jgi:signal transduction histidine kinase
LAATLAVALLVPIAIVAWVTVRVSADRVRAQALAQCASAAELARESISTFLDGASTYAELFARRADSVSAASAHDAVRMREVLSNMVSNNRNFECAFAVDPDGVEWANWPSDPAVIGQRVTNRAWFRGVVDAQATYVSEIYRRESVPRILLTAIAVPIRDGDEAVLGYLVGQVPLERLTTWLSRVRPPNDGSIALVDQRAFVVSDRRDHGVVPDARERLGTWMGPDPLTGEDAVLSHSAMVPYRWSVLVRMPASTVLRPVSGLGLNLVLLAWILYAILLSLAFYVLRSVRRHHELLLETQASKDRLALSIVHDLRNPLMALAGNIELGMGQLESRQYADAAHSYAQARVSAGRISQMVDTIVDVVRLEGGQLPVSPKPFDLATLAREKAAEYEARASRRGVRLAVDAPQRALVMADAGMVSRVVENLLTNALKHTPENGRIQVSVQPAAPDRGVELAVEDTGEGIADDDMPRLFTMYGRARGQEMGTPQDTGLGLVFCRLATEAQGGTIRAWSELGKGTRLSIRLPAAESERMANKRPDQGMC